MGRTGRVLGATVLALALASCSGGGGGGGGESSGPSRRPSPTTTASGLGAGASGTGAVAPAGVLVARIELRAHRVTAGSQIAGTVVVTNGTGHAVNVVGCISIFGVVLTNASVPPEATWFQCRQNITIPEGVSRYPVVVSAAYASCTQADPTAPTACLPGTGTRPLPPGRYRAVLVQSDPVVPPAKTVAVTVV